MRVRVARFRQALNLVQPAVSGRNATVSVTQNVLVRDGLLHATIMEVAVSVPLPELGGGPFTFPFAQMRDTLAYLPDYEVLELQVVGLEIQLETSRSSFTTPVATSMSSHRCGRPRNTRIRSTGTPSWPDWSRWPVIQPPTSAGR